MTRLLAASPSVRRQLGALFKERDAERIGSMGDALAFAMRVHCCNEVGLDAAVDVEKHCANLVESSASPSNHAIAQMAVSTKVLNPFFFSPLLR